MSKRTPENKTLERKSARRDQAQSYGCWSLLEIIVPHAPRLLLHGPPGTGKTHLAVHERSNAAQSVVSITVTEEMPAAEVRGHFVPQGDRFVWHDGPAIRAWREGARLVLNEIDHAGGDLLSQLLLLLDDATSARIDLPSGEVVTPAPGFSVIATMNGDPDTLPPALRDRFAACVEVNEVSPEALALLPSDVREAARATVALPEERRVSVRAWLTFALLRTQTGDEHAAAQAVFGKRATDVLDALRLANAIDGPVDEPPTEPARG